MRDRITNKDLNRLVEQLNILVNGEHVESGFKPGQYILDWAYGGVQLQRVETKGGGVHTVSHDGYGTKRQLYSFLRAFIAGQKA